MNRSQPKLSGLQNEQRARILVADDDNMMQAAVGNALASRGHDVILARDGREALATIRRETDRIDLILLDRNMPGFGGLDILRELQADAVLRQIPVIMQTSADKADDIREGLDAGVFYYLTKPFSSDVLQSVVNSAVRSVRRRKDLQRQMSRHHSGFHLIDQAVFSFRTVDDAENLACFAANCFPNPERALDGLYALLVNAIEHGHLGIGYAQKARLVAQGSWRHEIERRECLQENTKKTARLDLRRDATRVAACITDEGPGFDWRNYIQLDPARAFDSSGRGIAQAAAISFDEIAYNEKGNAVTATVFLKRDAL
ncbi:MAG: response regulator [Alphaproteobacteria bacterium]|nr:MAG: response regulator [Alphaproteobacteria bacterium]